MFPSFARYHLWPSNGEMYISTSAAFRYQDIDKYNWNNVDRYICETEKEYNQLAEVSRLN